MTITEPWMLADNHATWELSIKLKREEGLREGKFEPVNDDERRYAESCKELKAT